MTNTKNTMKLALIGIALTAFAALTSCCGSSPDPAPAPAPVMVAPPMK